MTVLRVAGGADCGSVVAVSSDSLRWRTSSGRVDDSRGHQAATGLEHRGAQPGSPRGVEMGVLAEGDARASGVGRREDRVRGAGEPNAMARTRPAARRLPRPRRPSRRRRPDWSMKPPMPAWSSAGVSPHVGSDMRNALLTSRCPYSARYPATGSRRSAKTGILIDTTVRSRPDRSRGTPPASSGRDETRRASLARPEMASVVRVRPPRESGPASRSRPSAASRSRSLEQTHAGVRQVVHPQGDQPVEGGEHTIGHGDEVAATPGCGGRGSGARSPRARSGANRGSRVQSRVSKRRACRIRTHRRREGACWWDGVPAGRAHRPPRRSQAACGPGPAAARGALPASG